MKFRTFLNNVVPTFEAIGNNLAIILTQSVVNIDLKIDNLDKVSIPTKIVATFDVEHPILGTTNEHPKSVNSGKITSALHVFYLNLNLLAQNSANCSNTAILLRMHALFRRHKWSQESGVRHQKWPRFL